MAEGPGFTTLAWALVPVLGLAELGGQLYFSSRPPRIEEWRAERPVLERLRRQGELVVVAPAWAEPNARAAFGDALMPLADVARPDESARPRAIEVSILGAEAPDLQGWRVVEEKRDGKFRFRVRENPSPAKVLYDFVDHVAEATVVDVLPAGETPCPWNPRARREAGGLHGDPAFPAMRHECKGAPWHFVGTTVVEDPEWRGRRCLWAQPSTAPLVIRYHDVPIGRVVRGYSTIPFWIEREKRGAPVEVQIRVGGEPIGTFVHADGDGWKRFELPTAARAGTRSDVEFRVSAKRPAQRQLCLQADTR